MQLSVLFVDSALKPVLGFTLLEVSSQQVLNALTSANPEVLVGTESRVTWGIKPAFAAFLGSEPALPQRHSIVSAVDTGYRDSRAAVI